MHTTTSTAGFLDGFRGLNLAFHVGRLLSQSTFTTEPSHCPRVSFSVSSALNHLSAASTIATHLEISSVFILSCVHVIFWPSLTCMCDALSNCCLSGVEYSCVHCGRRTQSEWFLFVSISCSLSYSPTHSLLSLCFVVLSEYSVGT